MVVVLVNVNASAWNELELSISSSDSSTPSSSSSVTSSSVKEHATVPIRFEYCWHAILQLVSVLSMGWNRTKVALVGVQSTSRWALRQMVNIPSAPNNVLLL